MSALETFEVLILDDKTGELRMDSRRGVRFVHEVLGTPIEFGLNFGGEPQTLKEIKRSCDVCSGHRTLKLTHLATGMSAGRVEVPPGKSASALERGTAQTLKQKADEAKRRAENDAKYAAYQRREGVFEAIREERRQQDKKWGEQTHPSLPPAEAPFTADAVCKALFLPTEKLATTNCQLDLEAGTLSWAAIATKELCVAVSAATEDLRRKDLVQLAAIVARWIECIDRTKLAEGGAS